MHHPPPAPRPRGRSALVIVLGAAGGFLGLIVVLILAVALLGTSTPSSQVDTASGGPPMGAVVPSSTLAPSTPPSSASTWLPWVAPDGRSTIAFPGTPDVQTRTLGGDVDTAVYARTESLSTGAYMLISLDISEASLQTFGDDATLLLGIVGSNAQTLGITVPTTETTELLGRPAVRVSGPVVIRGRSTPATTIGVRDGARAYVLIAVDGTAAPADLDQFVASFQIL